MKDLVKMPLVYHHNDMYVPINPDDGMYLEHEEVEEIIEGLKRYIDGIDNEMIKKYNIKRKTAIEVQHEELMAKLKTQIKEGYVYFIKTSSGAYKIGQTANLKSRIHSLKTLDENLELIHSIKVKNPLKVERLFHQYYSGKHLYSELFKLNSKDIDDIKRMNLPKEILENII